MTFCKGYYSRITSLTLRPAKT